jgi:hypothetical protein
MDFAFAYNSAQVAKESGVFTPLLLMGLICGIFLLISIIIDFNYYLIVLPMKEWERKQSGGPIYIAPHMLQIFYKVNKPMILREFAVLDFLIQYGGLLFFIGFSLIFLVLVYMVTNSIGWMLLCSPGLVSLYGILQLASIFLGTLLVQRKMRKLDRWKKEKRKLGEHSS